MITRIALPIISSELGSGVEASDWCGFFDNHKSKVLLLLDIFANLEDKVRNRKYNKFKKNEFG